MVLKLHTMPWSAGGRRVALLLHEKKVPYELVEPDWAAQEHKSEQWKEKQPFGQVPYIDDDGFILFESRAIARYIATKYASSGTALLPDDTSDPQAMALIDQGISAELSNFEPYVAGLVVEKLIKPLRGAEPDQAAVAKHEATLTEKMDGFELMLSKRKYMAGDSLTFVDLIFCPYGNALTKMGYDHLTNESKHPNLARWWKEISTRETWLAVKDTVPKSFLV